jgi:hypothetical protein
MPNSLRPEGPRRVQGVQSISVDLGISLGKKITCREQSYPQTGNSLPCRKWQTFCAFPSGTSDVSSPNANSSPIASANRSVSRRRVSKHISPERGFDTMHRCPNLSSFVSHLVLIGNTLPQITSHYLGYSIPECPPLASCVIPSPLLANPKSPTLPTEE